MKKKIAIVAATKKEIQHLHEFLEKEAIKYSDSTFQIHDAEIQILISGIGILNTTYSLMNYLMVHRPDAWIQMGIGGAFDTSLEIGKVYVIESEVLIDFGAQDIDVSIINQFQLGWTGPNQFPYSNEVLPCPYIPSDLLLPVVTGMTTIHSHGFREKIEKIGEGLHGQVENMEGAAFFYVSLMKIIPFLSLRSISNYVEERDLNKWNNGMAINNLNNAVIDFIKKNNVNLFIK